MTTVAGERDQQVSATTSVVQKAFDVLSAFGRGRVLTMSEVARLTGMPTSTVHRVLGMLVAVGAVEHDGARYRVALRMLSIGASSPESRVRGIAMPYLLDLHRAVGFTVHLGALRGREVVYLEKLCAPGGPTFATEVGMSLPAHCTALGKALLAHVGRDAFLGLSSGEPLAALTSRSLRDQTTLLGELERIRKRGLATDVEEAAPGRSCVAQPILVDGAPIAAVSIGFPTGRASVEQLAGPLRKVVGLITRSTAERLQATSTGACTRGRVVRDG